MIQVFVRRRKIESCLIVGIGKIELMNCGGPEVDWNEETTQRMAKEEGSGWYCRDCNYVSKVKNLLVSHIESQHLTGFPGYKCSLCGSHSTTYSGLEKHTSRQHSISLAKMKFLPSLSTKSSIL